MFFRDGASGHREREREGKQLAVKILPLLAL